MPDYDFFSDEQLLKAARDGDDAGWEALLRRHGQRLLVFFNRMNGGDTTAARALWLQLWSDLARLRPSLASGGRFSTTAFSLALKLAQGLAPKTGSGPQGESSSLEARSARLYHALAELPVPERAALNLGYFDNLSWEDLGRVLGCRPDEAKAYCAAAYIRLDEALGPDFLTAGL